MLMRHYPCQQEILGQLSTYIHTPTIITQCDTFLIEIYTG